MSRWSFTEEASSLVATALWYCWVDYRALSSKAQSALGGAVCVSVDDVLLMQ